MKPTSTATKNSNGEKLRAKTRKQNRLMDEKNLEDTNNSVCNLASIFDESTDCLGANQNESNNQTDEFQPLMNS